MSASAGDSSRYLTREVRRGFHVVVLDDVEIATVTFLDSVLDQRDRTREFCSAMARIDVHRAEYEAQIGYTRLGWESRAQHDAEWAKLVATTAGQPDEVRAYLNDRWKADGRSLPLSAEEMGEWSLVMATVLVEPSALEGGAS